MSIAALSTRIRSLTPPEELIGSFTRERVALMVRYAGTHIAPQEGLRGAVRWLAYHLDTDVPVDPMMSVAITADDAQNLETCDLMYWFDVENTEANRESMQQAADATLTVNVEALTNILCVQMGIAA